MTFISNTQSFKTYLEDTIAAIPTTEVNSADKMARLTKLLAWVNQSLEGSSTSGPSGLTAAELSTELARLGETTDPSNSNSIIGLLKAIKLRAEADTEIIEWEVKTTVAPNTAGDGIREVLVNGITTSWTNLRTGAVLTGGNIPAYTNLTKISNTASQLTQAQVLAAIDDSVTLDDIKANLDALVLLLSGPNYNTNKPYHVDTLLNDGDMHDFPTNTGNVAGLESIQLSFDDTCLATLENLTTGEILETWYDLGTLDYHFSKPYPDITSAELRLVVTENPVKVRVVGTIVVKEVV
jgi:hypothetical protein